jgi:hypothetical protein
MKSMLHPSNENRDTDENAFFSKSKEIFNVRPISTKFSPCLAYAQECGFKTGICKIVVEIQTKRYYVLQLKDHSIFTDIDETSTLCSACVYSARYKVFVTSLQWQTRYRRKSTLVYK